MDDLRALVESLGYSEVTTFIQSGNVLFSAKHAPEAAFLETAIAGRFGSSVSVVLRSAAQVRRILSDNPFDGQDPSALHVGFLTEIPPGSVVKGLDGRAFRPEDFAVRRTEVYLCLPNGMGRAKLPAYLDRALRIPMTVRNWNTVTKLADLLG
jgi:uncharacterized protein (DUF1697 family)